MGEVRRRWAAMLEKEGKLEEEVSFAVAGLSSEEEDSMEASRWLPLVQVMVDASAGL